MPFFAALREVEREDRERYARLSSLHNVRNYTIDWRGSPVGRELSLAILSDLFDAFAKDTLLKSKKSKYKQPDIRTRRPKLYAGK